MGIQGIEHVLYDQEDLFINSLALPRVRKREKSYALSGIMTSPVWMRHAFVNRLQTLALLAFLAGYLATLGYLLWGVVGVFYLSITGLLLILLRPAASPHLMMRLYHARPVSRHEAPQLYQVLTELSRRAGLSSVPTPYYLPSNIVNAFAVGAPENSAIAVTEGLLRSLEWKELVAVLAHEISHMRNNDLRVMGLADMASRFTSALSLVGQLFLLLNLPLLLFSNLHINWLAVVILLLAPQLSALAQLGLSRVREYDADLNAALLIGEPESLARALIKLENQQSSLWKRVLMPGYSVPGPSLLRTHPPTKERIKRLMALREPLLQAHSEQVNTGHLETWKRWREQQIRCPRWHINGLWH